MPSHETKFQLLDCCNNNKNKSHYTWFWGARVIVDRLSGYCAERNKWHPVFILFILGLSTLHKWFARIELDMSQTKENMASLGNQQKFPFLMSNVGSWEWGLHWQKSRGLVVKSHEKKGEEIPSVLRRDGRIDSHNWWNTRSGHG